MSGDDHIRLTGVVTEVLGGSRFRVRLANGHELVARLPRRRSAEAGAVQQTGAVRLRLSPADLGSAVIEEILN